MLMHRLDKVYKLVLYIVVTLGFIRYVCMSAMPALTGNIIGHKPTRLTIRSIVYRLY